MTLNDSPTYYDLLELSPDASPQEVRAAYLRAKSAYKRDSVALYTLMDESETEALLQRIEEAYHVLSNPEKRREYDRQYGLLVLEEPLPSQPDALACDNVVSIDRVPPMESPGDTDLLIPPATDFTASSPSTAAAGGMEVFGSTEAPITSARGQFAASAPLGSHRPQSAPTPKAPGPSATVIAEEIAREIAQETEWRGPFIRRVREASRVSIEEMAEFTKISKTYINAIEEENFAKLPAAVYLRGFVTQISKSLKLPHERVVAAYMARFAQFQQDKGK